MPRETTVRDATEADLPRVKEIYDDQVHNGIATFDTEPPPIAYWATKLASKETGHHLLVAVADEKVVGYAYSTTYRPRRAYERTREISVYLAEQGRGRGVGRALYDELLARLRTDGVHVVLAMVALPNEASEALHRACGFKHVGVLPQVGFKLGRWVDTGLWALRLTD